MQVVSFRALCLAAAVIGCVPAWAQSSGGESAVKPAKPVPRAYMMRADKNGDDLVSRDEYIADAYRRFVRLDADRDGTVTRSEIERAADRIAAGIKARMLKQFAGNDPDKDGKFLRAESDLAASIRFAELDVNSDGKLASADFMKARTARKRKPAAEDGPD